MAYSAFAFKTRLVNRLFKMESIKRCKLKAELVYIQEVNINYLI
jgi:hypothetical protein